MARELCRWTGGNSSTLTFPRHLTVLTHHNRTKQASVTVTGSQLSFKDVPQTHGLVDTPLTGSGALTLSSLERNPSVQGEMRARGREAEASLWLQAREVTASLQLSRPGLDPQWTGSASISWPDWWAQVQSTSLHLQTVWVESLSGKVAGHPSPLPLGVQEPLGCRNRRV